MYGGVEVVLPTVSIDVSVGGASELHVTLLAARASLFGVYCSAMGMLKNPTWHPLRPPSDNELLCQEVRPGMASRTHWEMASWWCQGTLYL
jgi:hypothetical protein